MRIVRKIISTKNRLIFILFRRKLIQKFLKNHQSMSGSAIHELMAKISKDKNILEFGSGSSTIQLSKISKRLVSVESDKVLISELKKNIKNTQTHIYYANVGPVMDFGTPVLIFKSIFKNSYKNYHTKIFNLNSRNTKFDVIIIDGRFRVACFLNSLNFVQPPFIIFFDDYFSRIEYKIIESFKVKLVQRADDCAVFYVEDDYRGKVSKEMLDQYNYVTA